MLAPMTPLQEHLRNQAPVRVLYTDFDGTLLGPDGSLLAGPDGRPSARAADALVAAAAADVTVVPVSGRRRSQLQHDARLLGLADLIAEAGCCIVRDGALSYEWGACPPDLAANPHDALEVAGAVDVLLERFRGDLRHYEPWHLGREGSHLFHGLVDVASANATLAEIGCGWAHLIDNGATSGWPGRAVRAYHLLPRGVGKGPAVGDDLAARGLAPAQAAAVGDSLEDLTMSDHVGTYFIVGNGHGEQGGNAFRLEEAFGHGFAAAVGLLLDAETESD
jgi:phosphoglycolate phosphatase